MRKRFLGTAMVASMALGTAVAPAFAAGDEPAPTPAITTPLNCNVSFLGQTISYRVTIPGVLPVVSKTITLKNGVTVTVTSGANGITVQYPSFTASCTTAL